ncbi:lanthionine synthetase LanC family protein [Bacteroides pyogenes]|nr:lanthionine synthetase LanC family protein [Bacteroides pyogenes]
MSEKKNIPYNDELLQRIANHLILHGSLLDNLGLCHGKMGVAIFLYRYAQFTGNKTIADFADELLEEIVNEIHDELPIDFANGYCGIGWSIEYLLHNRFVEGTSNEILTDIDRKIMERDVRRITDRQLFHGTEGILHYVIFRLYRCGTDTPFDNEYLEDIYILASEIKEQKKENSISELASQFLLWKDGKEMTYYPDKLIKKILFQNDEQNLEIAPLDLGLKNGCAGKGLNIIFHETKSVHTQ